jgi:hypothetical protein
MAIHKNSDRSGYLGCAPNKNIQPGRTMIIDNVPEKIHLVKVYEFTVRDCDDPMVHAAEPMYKWQESEHGKWVFEHSLETPKWNTCIDYSTYGHKFVITAKLKESDKIIWALKFK